MYNFKVMRLICKCKNEDFVSDIFFWKTSIASGRLFITGSITMVYEQTCWQYCQSINQSVYSETGHVMPFTFEYYYILNISSHRAAKKLTFLHNSSGRKKLQYVHQVCSFLPKVFS